MWRIQQVLSVEVAKMRRHNAGAGASAVLCNVKWGTSAPTPDRRQTADNRDEHSPIPCHRALQASPVSESILPVLSHAGLEIEWSPAARCRVAQYNQPRS